MTININNNNNKKNENITSRISWMVMLGAMVVINYFLQSNATSSSSSCGSPLTFASKHNYDDSDLLDNFNYTWMGDRFFPPPGVPTFNIDDYLKFFQNHDVLWMGDSTMRRAYLTAQILMNQTQEGHRFEDLDLAVVNRGATLNINQGGQKVVSEHCNTIEDYLWTKEKTAGGVIFDGKTVFNALLCRKTRQSNRRNDFAYFSCFRDVTKFYELDASLNQSTTSGYDISVIGAGMWDAQSICDSQDVVQDLNKAIDAVRKVASPQHRVIWRTPGFSADRLGESKISVISEILREQLGTEKYIYLADWSNIIYRRSFGQERAPPGDNTQSHYGFEARLLFLNMLLQHLHNIELEQRDEKI